MEWTSVSSPELHPSEPRRQYSFGDFTLDLDCGLLRRAGQEVPLRPKVFETLAYLVEHHGRVVRKATLIEAIWPNTAITDNSLPQCILEIRRALMDDSQELIRTVSRRGYVFTAPVSTPVLEFPSPVIAAMGEPGAVEAVPATARPARRRRLMLVAAGLVLAALAGTAIVALQWIRPARHSLTYTQITN